MSGSIFSFRAYNLACICDCNRQMIFIQSIFADVTVREECNMNQDKMPVGFAMAMAMNPEAMKKFSSMNEIQQKEIIDGTENIKSKEEMHRYVESLLNKKI